MIPFSPSNMDAFRLCPRRFQGQSITKEIKYKPTPSKSRGIAVHSRLEYYVKSRKDLPASGLLQLPDGVDTGFVHQHLQQVRQLAEAGYSLHTEHELAVNDRLQTCDWWAVDCLLRAKADVLLAPASGEDILYLLDWKTGKKWDTEDFQLRVEALIAHLIYGTPNIIYKYIYVDSADIVEGLVDFSGGLHQVQDIVDLMKEMKECINGNIYIPKRNRFCKWCDFWQTQRCSSSSQS